LQDSERRPSEEREPLVAIGDAEAQEDALAQPVAKVDDDEDDGPADSPFFHFIMVLASMYSGMLLTNWAVDLTDTSRTFNLGKQNMWVNIITQWVIFALYLWTLLAPTLLPNRDFGFGH